MRCDEFAGRLDDVLDQRCDPTADPALRKHAQVCPGCREELAATARLLTGLEVWEAPAPSPDFAQRVVAQVLAVDHHRPWYRSTWCGWVVAAAALLLVALLPAYWLAFQNGNRTAAATTPSADARLALADANANGAQFDPVFHNSLSHNSLSHNSQSNNSLWSHYGTSIWQLYPESARERHRQQVSDIADDLRPIATSFNAAVSAIRRTIPVGRTPDRTPSRTSRSSARLVNAIS
jgi:hypothetical protein